MNPLVSVIMSTLNTQKDYLEAAINSILNQTYKNFEFIIIVDGGNDDKIIEKINDNRIKIIKHKNSIGLTKSLNEAIKISTGKYIARMDSDDISLENRFEYQVNYMEKYLDVDITSMFYKEIGTSSKVVQEVYNKPDEVKCKLFFTNLIAHPCVMIRKEFLDKNNILYDEKYIYSQDLELWTRSVNFGKIAIIPKFGLHYRIHDKQISTEKSSKQMDLYRKILTRNLNELNISEENLKYLLMLNGKEKVNNAKELKKFVKLALNMNKKLGKYDYKKFKEILKVYYNIALIKSRKLFFPNLSFLKYVVRSINIKNGDEKVNSKGNVLTNKLRKILEYIKRPQYILLWLDRKRIITLDDEKFLKTLYEKTLKKELNLENPKTFNEKLQWLKLYDRNPEYIKMVDKYDVKEYVSNIIGNEYIIQTLGIYDKFEDINFEQLPDKFIIKCTHDSASTVICKDKKTFNYEEAKNKINKCLKKNYFYEGREWPYKSVKPRIIIEKYMEDSIEEVLRDYKFMCFNGKVRCSFVCSNRYSKDGINVDFFDMEWKKMPFERHYKNSNVDIAKPINYELMIELSEKLSKNIPFVRVDWYEINGKVYFGELTFYPGNGLEEFTPEKYDDILGSWISLPNIKN